MEFGILVQFHALYDISNLLRDWIPSLLRSCVCTMWGLPRAKVSDDNVSTGQEGLMRRFQESQTLGRTQEDIRMCANQRLICSKLEHNCQYGREYSVH
jgi:hypothetical protein